MLNPRPNRPVRRSRVSLAFVEKLESRCLLSTSATAGDVAVVPSALMARQMELLDRAVVAIYRGSGNVFLSWRMLGNDPASISFNVYRATNGGTPSKRNATPITTSTNFLDSGISISSTYSYTVCPVIGGVEGAASKAFVLGPNPSTNQYLNVPMQIPGGGTTPSGETYTYSANDCSVGDLDGDGEYELVVKWEPSNAKDNSQSGYTGNVYLDAYKLNGTRLWRIDLGRNIRAGAHYTQFMVYDLDGDGRAEVACKTGDGSISGTGQVIGNGAADWRNTSGYILSGPEYLTLFDGRTGAILTTTNYLPARGNVSDWGDNYGNRVDRFLACIAYLDGQRPSLVMCRGYYTRAVLVAWDWRNGALTQRWTFDSNTSGNGGYAGQGNHNISVADVDADGKDEIIYGACSIDDNGKGLYTTGYGHGDALHVSDMDPDRPGLEIWDIHEPSGVPGSDFRDARTGVPIFTSAIVPAGVEGPGRGVAADIYAGNRGYEMWGGGGLFDRYGNVIGRTPSSSNFLVWWDADPVRELLDGTHIDKYGTSGDTRLLTASGVSSNNSTKSTPNLSADILGDWREEVVWRTTDSSALRIYTTVDITSTRIYTLMHDPQYRLAIAWQNVAYNQPPHPGFFLGDGMSAPPTPNIYFANADTTAPTASGQFVCETMQNVIVQYSEPMKPSTISEADLVLHPTSYSGPDRLPYVASYNVAANTATYYFWGALPDGNYIATIAGNAVTDMAGNPMASGFSLDLYTLGGDANRDRKVDIRDLYVVASNFGQGGRTFSQGDFNYDGSVDANDLGILSSNWQKDLPMDSLPAAPASTLKIAPKRTATRVISLL